jgi:hypothetical protein
MGNSIKGALLAVSAAIIISSLPTEASAGALFVANHSDHVVTFVRSDNAVWTGVIYPGESVDVGLYMHDNKCVHRLSASSSTGNTWGPHVINQCSDFSVSSTFTWNLVDSQ